MTTASISTTVNTVNNSTADAEFTKAAAVQPARGQFLRACQGEILVMLTHYGWIMSSDNIDYTDDDKKTSKRICVHKNDVVNGESLMQGDLVTFDLYSKYGSLRAESCELKQRAPTGRSPTGQQTCSAPSSDNESDGSVSFSVRTLSEDASTSASIADYDSSNESVPAESEPDAVPWGNVASKIGSKLADLSDSDAEPVFWLASRSDSESDSASTGAPGDSEPDVLPWGNGQMSPAKWAVGNLSDVDSANEAAPAESEPDVVPWANVASKIGSKLADLSDSDSGSQETPSDSEPDVVPWGKVANRLGAKLGAMSDIGSDNEAAPIESEPDAMRWSNVASIFSSQLEEPDAVPWGNVASKIGSKLADLSDSDSASQGTPSDSEPAVLPWSNVASRLGTKLSALSDDDSAKEAALMQCEPDVVPWGNVASRLGAKLSALTEEVVSFPEWAPEPANDFATRSVVSSVESVGARFAGVDDFSGIDADTESYDGDTESYDGDKDSFDGNHEKNDSDDESVHSAFDDSRSHTEDIEWDSDIGEVLPSWHKRGIAYLASLEKRNERCQDDMVMKVSLKSPGVSSDESTSIESRSGSPDSAHSAFDETTNHKDDIEWDSDIGEPLPSWHKRGLAHLAYLEKRNTLSAPPGLSLPQGLTLPPGLTIQCNDVDVDTLCKECSTLDMHTWGCSVHRTYTSALLLMHRRVQV